MTRSKPLSRQTIVITGATSGIGLTTAREAARRGANVVLVARNATTLAQIHREIRDEGGDAIHVSADVARREDLDRVAREALRAFGAIDTWVNNAGGSVFGELLEISDEDHRRLMDVNFWGVVYGSTIAARHMRERGGTIINLGSIASDIALPLQGMYSASKHAIKGFTDALREELAMVGAPITVTLIKPASIDTPFPMHAKTYRGVEPKLPPPVYRPEEVTLAILHAAEHGGRDIYVGGGGKAMSSLRKHLPWLTDLGGAHVISKLQDGAPLNRDPSGSLYRPGRGGRMHGTSPHHVMRSAYTRASIHPVATAAILGGVGLVAAFLAQRR